MKKRVFALITIALLSCCAFAACSEDEHVHDYVQTVVEPSCTEEGYTKYECACGESYIENKIVARGHSDFTNKVTPPTCSVGGYTTSYCGHCSYFKIVDNSYTDATGHSFKAETEVVLPGCITQGYTVRECEKCGLEVYGDYTAASGHTFVNNECTVCKGTEFTFTLSEDGESYSVKKGTASLLAASIPSAYNGKPVTKIESSAFYYCPLLKSVEIPDSVTEIGSSAFFKCNALKTVTIGGGVTKIGNRAFADCVSVTSLSFNAEECLDFAEDNEVFLNIGASGEGVSLSLGNHVTKIPSYAFRSTEGATAKIKSLSADSDCALQSIGEGTFEECSALEDIVIPENVTRIGAKAFSNCLSLKKIAYHAKSVASFAVDNGVFNNAGAAGEGIALTVGNKVQVIAENTFYPDSLSENTPNLATVTFESGSVCTEVGKKAFASCNKLTAISFPQSVQTIGEGALWGCASLETLTVPFVGGSIKTAADEDQYPLGYIFGTTGYEGGARVNQIYYGKIGEDGKLSTENRTYYIIPSSLKTVVVLGGNVLKGAFQNCKTIENITVPENITSIGESAFQNCAALKSATIQQGVSSIGVSAFQGCTNLQSLTYKATDCADFDTGLGLNQVFSNAGSRGEGVDVTVSKNVLRIPDNLFYPDAASVPKLKSVTFESGSECLSIGNSAFADSKYLATVVFGAKLESIAQNAFRGCIALTAVDLPEPLTSVGVSAFSGCTELAVINSKQNLIDIRTSAFDNTKFFNTESNWKDGVLIMGKVLVKAKEDIREYFFGSDVIYIADNSFSGCKNLDTVVFSDAVSTIGNEAFNGCSALVSLDLPSNIVSIGDKAFANCTGLTEIKYNARCTGFTVESNIFSGSGVQRNTKVIFDKSLQEVPSYLFYRVTRLNRIIFEKDSVCTRICNNAFDGCAGVDEINLPKTLQKVDSGAFNSAMANRTVFVEYSSAEWATVKDNLVIDGVSSSNAGFNGSLTSPSYYSETTLMGGWRYVNGEPQKW